MISSSYVSLGCTFALSILSLVRRERVMVVFSFSAIRIHP
jgi:hypothetical protein